MAGTDNPPPSPFDGLPVVRAPVVLHLAVCWLGGPRPPPPPLPPQQATHGSCWRWWRLLIIGPMCASPASTSLGFSSTRQTATPPAASTSVRVLGSARLLYAVSSLSRSAPSLVFCLAPVCYGFGMRGCSGGSPPPPVRPPRTVGGWPPARVLTASPFPHISLPLPLPALPTSPPWFGCQLWRLLLSSSLPPPPHHR